VPEGRNESYVSFDSLVGQVRTTPSAHATPVPAHATPVPVQAQVGASAAHQAGPATPVSGEIIPSVFTPTGSRVGVPGVPVSVQKDYPMAADPVPVPVPVPSASLAAPGGSSSSAMGGWSRNSTTDSRPGVESARPQSSQTRPAEGGSSGSGQPSRHSNRTVEPEDRSAVTSGREESGEPEEVIDLAALEREVDGLLEARGVPRGSWQHNVGTARENLSEVAYRWALELMRDSSLLTWQECLSAAEALDYTPPPLPSQDPQWREMIHPTRPTPWRH
jgi:hypothetical protein